MENQMRSSNVGKGDKKQTKVEVRNSSSCFEFGLARLVCDTRACSDIANNKLCRVSIFVIADDKPKAAANTVALA
ncbi:hypothetical protein T03_9727 [Trichinella britovi]|uniref:Uncharacterized protein n=1 Tax=Trichinella britovi TaxID=45882 RepID=A0A0V1DIW2_TRIBR|nr:hypothetical protein T03_9727 [Trichinella britovi]KRZ98053.1 hypothetical protein T08_13255 [Trichinella sp. T8]